MKIINESIFKGIAGGRNIGSRPKGVVIHNDGGSMTPSQYVTWLKQRYKNGESSKGFAHYYGNRDEMARVEDTYNAAWHTANYEGNQNYVGYEVCQSFSATDEEFLANEQAVFKQVAEDMIFWGLDINRNTVRLHKEFSSTDCPHRSWALHGKSVNAVKDYFIEQIMKYIVAASTNNNTQNKVVQEVLAQGSKDKIAGLGYRMHVQSKSPNKAGTLGYVKEGETAGTTGKGLRAEWLEVLYDGKGSPFEIDTHVQKKGWLGYRKGSQGTKGKSLRMEAVRIRIADAALAKTHSIMYRVHSQTYGWGAWVKDGAIAGTTGKSKRMEAIQIKLVKK